MIWIKSKITKFIYLRLLFFNFRFYGNGIITHSIVRVQITTEPTPWSYHQRVAIEPAASVTLATGDGGRHTARGSLIHTEAVQGQRQAQAAHGPRPGRGRRSRQRSPSGREHAADHSGRFRQVFVTYRIRFRRIDLVLTVLLILDLFIM